jgi:hypothetical protein
LISAFLKIKTGNFSPILLLSKEKNHTIMSCSIPPQVDGDILGRLFVTVKQIKGPSMNKLMSFSITGKIQLWGDEPRDLDHRNTICYDLRGTWNILHQYFLDSGEIPLFIALIPPVNYSSSRPVNGWINMAIPFESLLRYLKPKVQKSSIIREIPIAFNSESLAEYTAEIEIALILSDACHNEAMDYQLVHDFESIASESDDILSEIGFKPPKFNAKSRNQQTSNTIHDSFIKSKDLYDTNYQIDALDVAPKYHFGRKCAVTKLDNQEETFGGEGTAEVKPTAVSSTLDSYVTTIQKWWRSCESKKCEHYEYLNRNATIIQFSCKRYMKELRHKVPSSISFSDVPRSSDRLEGGKPNKVVNEFTIRFDEVYGLREHVLLWELANSNPLRNKMAASGIIISFSLSTHGPEHFTSEITQIDSFDRAIFHLKSVITGKCSIKNSEEFLECCLWIVPNVNRKMLIKYPTINQHAQDIPSAAKILCSFRCPLISLSDPDECAKCYLCPLSTNVYPLLDNSASIGKIKVTIGMSDKMKLLNTDELIFMDEYASDDSLSFESSQCSTTSDSRSQINNEKSNEEFNVGDGERLSEDNICPEKNLHVVHIALSPINSLHRTQLSLEQGNGQKEPDDIDIDFSNRDLSSLLESMDCTTQALIKTAMPKTFDSSNTPELTSISHVTDRVHALDIDNDPRMSPSLCTPPPKEEHLNNLGKEAKIYSGQKERFFQMEKPKIQTNYSISASESTSPESYKKGQIHQSILSPVGSTVFSSVASYTGSSFTVSDRKKKKLTPKASFDDLSLSSSSLDNTRYPRITLGQRSQSSKSDSSIIDDDSSDISSLL